MPDNLNQIAGILPRVEIKESSRVGFFNLEKMVTAVNTFLDFILKGETITLLTK